MPYTLSIPARINILGNPSDANEGDFATISAAVGIFAGADIDKADEIILEQVKKTKDGYRLIHHQRYARQAIPLPYDGEVDLIKGAVNRLYQYSLEFQEKLEHHGFHITTWTDVPRQSGLGGSTLFVLLTLAGLRTLYDLDPYDHNDYLLAELTQRVEAKELCITCGYSDRYVPLLGGLAYLDYRGKLEQIELNQEPYVTYERLDAWVDTLPLVAVSSGVIRDSGDVHGQMRPRYLEEHRAWIKKGGEMPPMVQLMSKAWETAWRGKISLLKGDWKTFGQLMNQNHQLVDEMMTYCGFSDGAGWANNLLIETALANGALGAKLTGAGGGGSVFALTQPGDEFTLIDAWNTVIAKNDLANARIYRPEIVHQGLTIRELVKVAK
jgi:galactokinase/mevalonate kinase-like predicted kinase